MTELVVKIPACDGGSYPIVIGTGILPGLLERVEQQLPNKTFFIITDVNVAAAGHLSALTQGRSIASYAITPAGEPSKNMATLTAILETMESHRLGRDTVVIGLGGGTVGDIAGFAAAVFKRGVPVVHIPTTTVAQADSSVGGKTGVDSSLSKNAYGCFWHPAAVYIDTATLKTLDDVQYRAGLAESVKHAAILDAGYFVFLEQHIDAILRRDTATMETLAECNCRIKAAVVEKDPTEKNLRRILNYGHTLGHAVESASHYQLLHGQCVAIGMIAAGRIEKMMGLVNDDRMERIENLLMKLGLPTRIENLNSKIKNQKNNSLIEQLMELLSLDKKAVGQWPRFVLLEKLGQVYCKAGQWAVEAEPKAVRTIIAALNH